MWGLQLFLEDVLKITNIRSIIIYHNKQANWHTGKIWKENLTATLAAQLVPVTKITKQHFGKNLPYCMAKMNQKCALLLFPSVAQFSLAL